MDSTTGGGGLAMALAAGLATDGVASEAFRAMALVARGTTAGKLTLLSTCATKNSHSSPTFSVLLVMLHNRCTTQIKFDRNSKLVFVV